MFREIFVFCYMNLFHFVNHWLCKWPRPEYWSHKFKLSVYTNPSSRWSSISSSYLYFFFSLSSLFIPHHCHETITYLYVSVDTTPKFSYDSFVDLSSLLISLITSLIFFEQMIHTFLEKSTLTCFHFQSFSYSLYQQLCQTFTIVLEKNYLTSTNTSVPFWHFEFCTDTDILWICYVSFYSIDSDGILHCSKSTVK